MFSIDGRAIPATKSTDTYKYLGHSFSTKGVAKPSIFNLTKWLKNLARSPLKPDQKFALLKGYLIPKLLYGLQVPSITAGVLAESDRLIRKFTKKTLHLCVTTGQQLLYARVRDGGLGIFQLRRKIPFIFANRIYRLKDMGDEMTNMILSQDPTARTITRLEKLAEVGDPNSFWREQIATRPFSAGLQAAEDDQASRTWLESKPAGWTGRDYVRAVQLRTNNLATAGLPSTPAGLRNCRAGCPRVESLSHVLQGCPVTHFERIARHDEIVRKIAAHTRRKGWHTEVEPRVYHPDKQLFKPDLAIHLRDGNTIAIVDAQVCWEGTRALAQSWENKRLVYDNLKFRQAAERKWPGKLFEFLPLIVGARGIWPSANQPTDTTLRLTKSAKANMVHEVLKWGSTSHKRFMASVWR